MFVCMIWKLLSGKETKFSTGNEARKRKINFACYILLLVKVCRFLKKQASHDSKLLDLLHKKIAGRSASITTTIISSLFFFERGVMRGTIKNASNISRIHIFNHNKKPNKKNFINLNFLLAGKRKMKNRKLVKLSFPDFSLYLKSFKLRL